MTDATKKTCCSENTLEETTCCGSSPAKLWKLFLWALLLMAAIIILVTALGEGEQAPDEQTKTPPAPMGNAE